MHRRAGGGHLRAVRRRRRGPACRRIIHISAIGASTDGPTAFARTKAQADAHLASLDLDWVILRPTLVLAPAAYGGTAMLRGLAGLPWVVPSVASQVQIVIETLAPRMGAVDLVIGLDSGCGDYERLWTTTSLRGLVGGVLASRC